MSITDTPKRRGENKSYYHYLVYNDDTESHNYYKTTNAIAAEFGCSRATIYNIMSSPNKLRRKFKNLRIIKSYQHTEVVKYINQQTI